jgi:hypothetical protein
MISYASGGSTPDSYIWLVEKLYTKSMEMWVSIIPVGIEKLGRLEVSKQSQNRYKP